jgi:uncharacterized protein (TIGR03435 family)
MFRAAGMFVAAAAVCGAQPAFEVASIREHVVTGVPRECAGGPPISGNRMTRRCASLRALILTAYDAQSYQISGGPAWLDAVGTTLYDIAAEAPGDEPLTMERARPMLRALLAERFQLKLHRETREVPIYALTIGKGGSKLKESAPDAKASLRFLMGGLRARVEAPKESMAQLASYLSDEAGRPVVDQTGLTGSYEVKLEWIRDQPQAIPGVAPPAAAPPDVTGPSLFTAIQEQLGLKLEPKKGPIDMLIVDRAEKPSEN